jgi:hypothetical protein
MAKKSNQTSDPAGAIRKLTIVQLGLAGIGQAQIRKIVGGGIGEINGIVKLLKTKKKRGEN